MKAKVVGIESGSLFTDKERRVTLRFEDADAGFAQIRVREVALGFLAPLSLDEEISTDMVSLGRPLSEAVPQQAGGLR